MRKGISVFLIVTILWTYCAPTALAQEIGGATKEEEANAGSPAKEEGKNQEGDSLFMCHMRGEEDAKSMSTGGSFVGGLAGGVFLGLIGTLIAVVAQSESDPPSINLLQLQDESEECRFTYINSFRERSLKKKKSSALTGGLIGTAVLVLVVVAASGE